MDLIHPSDEAGVADAMRAASAAETGVLVVGGRQHMHAADPSEADAELWTTGLDGVVASPQEIGIVREEVANPNFLIITPGIRAVSSAADDQRRVMTAAKAITDGADYIVVGRPILNADDPVRAAWSIVEQIGKGLSN